MKVPTKFFGVVLSVFFLGCSSDKEIETIEEDLKVDAIELSSPEGFKIAESEKGLRELVGGNINIAPNVVEIESVEFVDMENVSIAYVNYRNLNTEQSSNIVIVDGVFNYDAHHLNISDISNKSAD